MAKKFYASGMQTRDKILTTSKELFYEKGFEATLYDDICKIAQVNRALIPYHFKNKADLALAVYDEYIDGYVQTRNYLYEEYSAEEKLVFGILYYYRLLENENVGRFVYYIISENSYRERLLLGESVMYKKVIPSNKKISKDKWDMIVHMIWAMEAENCKMIYRKQYEDIHDAGKVMIQMILEYFGYTPQKIGQILKKEHRILDQYEYTVNKDFTIEVRDKESKELIVSSKMLLEKEKEEEKEQEEKEVK